MPAAAASEANGRRLHPVLALLAGLAGIGYLYVGRIGLAVAALVAMFAVLLIGGWTRWLVHPTGWYVVILAAVLIAAVPVLHAVLIAWRRPIVPRKPYNRWWIYLGWFVVLSTICDLVIIDNRARAMGYEIFYIPSGAMEPTLRPGDWIVVDTWRYRSSPPAFGDLVVYRPEAGLRLIKRLVGLPGDTLEMRGRVLVRNGSPVDEPYLHEPIPGIPAREMRRIELGPDEYFVLGDNRDNSNDSRFMGPVRHTDMVGRTEFIALSFSGGVRWERLRTRLAAD